MALAFAAIYLIWGSTYLAIRVAIETMPPFLMAGLRFLLAGAVLYTFLAARGAPRPSRAHWRSALIAGSLMLVVGNGLVVWAEQSVPSGLAAVLVALMPLWMVSMTWARGEPAPSGKVLVGLALGIAGVALLVRPWDAGAEVPLLGGLAVVTASLGWAAGSLFARRAPLPRSPFQATALEMLAGGAVLMVVSGAAGEWGRADLGAVSLESGLAFLYLAGAGSIVALSAYVWLLTQTTPARISTYALVNPAVAVALGFLLAGEPVSLATLTAAAVILAAVGLIVAGQAAPRPRPDRWAVVPGRLRARLVPRPRP